jgi:hypothetical protein
MSRCETRQEQDEIVCRCGLRWDTREAKPPCGKMPRVGPVTRAVRRLENAVPLKPPASKP